jgi:hypothetical protein
MPIKVVVCEDRTAVVRHIADNIFSGIAALKQRDGWLLICNKQAINTLFEAMQVLGSYSFALTEFALELRGLGGLDMIRACLVQGMRGKPQSWFE